MSITLFYTSKTNKKKRESGSGKAKVVRWCLSRALKEIKEQPCRYGGKNVPGRDKSRYEGPAAGNGVAESTKEARVAGTQGGAGVFGWGKGRAGPQITLGLVGYSVASISLF